MPTVLVVDDDADMRLLVRVTLEMSSEGLAIIGEADDGTSALEVWRHLDARPDVVVLDNRMPGSSGLEVAAAMLQEHPEQVIILFSAFLDNTTRADAAALGVKTCIAKADLETIPSVVRHLLAA